MNNVSVLALTNNQVDLLLSNHELFSPEEIKIAAKLKVLHQKQADYQMRVLREEINQSYNHYRIKAKLARDVYAA